MELIHLLAKQWVQEKKQARPTNPAPLYDAIADGTMPATTQSFPDVLWH